MRKVADWANEERGGAQADDERGGDRPMRKEAEPGGKMLS